MTSARPLRRLALALSALYCLLVGVNCAGAIDLPGPVAPGTEAFSAEDAAVEAQPICIGSTVRSAGRLGDALLYRRSELPDGRVAVGYYVFYSEERPWGNNWLTWSVVPALAIDLVYTRAALVGPGLQRAAYGKGDVEGFRVIYRVGEDGRLEAEEAVADDDHHRPRTLSRSDLYAIDPSRITMYTSSWSHQLGARGAQPAEIVSKRCYGPGSIRPMTGAVARDFHLERRALPAAVGPLEPVVPSLPAYASRGAFPRSLSAPHATAAF